MIEALGTNGGMDPEEGTTSFLINESILLDAGSGLERLPLKKQRKIRTVLISHSHLDHHGSLAYLVNNLVSENFEQIEVLSTLETITALKKHIYNDVIWPDFTKIPDQKKPILKFKAVSCKLTFTLVG